jgi:L-ascorbate metabolism protein UlaG (beta-lactamase superfamily)
MWRNLKTLSNFAVQAAPMFWRKLQEERKRPVELAPKIPDIGRWTDSGVHAAWIGHSTVLLRIDGFTILTDPVFSKRIGIGIGPLVIGIKRLVHPALSIKELPTPDLVLLSHAHMDHFDIPSLRKLESPRTTVVTATGTSDLLRVRNYRAVEELRWDEACQVGPVRIQAFEVKHWGARMQTDTYRGYNGYVMESGRYRIVFAGDTAYTDTFRTVRSSRPVDLAIMPIGAYDPWIRAHCNPEQALAMADRAGAELILPVHHQTFKLSNEPLNEPIDRLMTAMGPADYRIPIRNIGDEMTLAFA